MTPDEVRELARTHHWRLLVGGEPREAADGATYESVDPSTGDVVASAPDAGTADVEDAVSRAREAAGSWDAVSVHERMCAVRRLADLLREHVDELGALDALDCGNPVTAMRGDVELAAELIERYADDGSCLTGHTFPTTTDHLHYSTRVPYGVVARIIPYNHPAMFTAARMAAPLIAGNAVVVKAPHQAPLSALRIGELFADALPAGVLSILSGVGPATGEALVRHPDVRRIGFIGSVATGRAIQRTAAEAGVKNVTLELGGKNPLIICEDADIPTAAEAAVRGMNFHWTAGQSCGSTSRLLVPSGLHDEVVDRVRAHVEAIRLGPALDERSEMGPLVSREQHAKVVSYVEGALGEGATTVTGGGRPADEALAAGWFFAPTVLTGVTPDMTVANEEIFGPVLSVLSYEDEEEAVRIANGTDYGLTASIWTRDLTRAHRLVERMEAGCVWVNTVSRHYPGTPFGGFKDSGIGREESAEEILSYTQERTAHIALG